MSELNFITKPYVVCSECDFLMIDLLMCVQVIIIII